MLDSFTLDNRRDFNQRYRGSYGWYTEKETQRKIFVLMREVGEDRITFVDQAGNPYMVNAGADVVFEFLPATKKLFVFGQDLLYIRRRPQRQWARGINIGNTRLCNVKTPDGDIALSFPRMVAAIAPQKHSVLELMAKLSVGEIGVAALSNQFGVIGTTLYLYDNVIGTISFPSRRITMTEPMFRQEVQDLMEKNFVGYEVVSANG
jgi:hypothetical protein